MRWCWKAWKPPPRAAPRSSALMAGCGELADSFHRTRSSPDGKPIIGCVRNALVDAGLDVRPDRLHQRPRHRHAGKRQDGVSRHCRRVFGERAAKIPVSSNKSMVGHTLSAAGAVEAVFSLLTLGTPADPADRSITMFPIRPFRSTWCPILPAMRRVTAVMSNSFGFGGQNASLILTGEPV